MCVFVCPFLVLGEKVICAALQVATAGFATEGKANDVFEANPTAAGCILKQNCETIAK